ncbi:MAG: tetratricopeptide repeat protein [Candidatus Xenobia bacterium]
MKRNRTLLLVLLCLAPAMAGTVPTPDWYQVGVKLYYSHPQPLAAVTALRRAVQAEPKSAMAHLMLSRALMRAGQVEAAFNESQEAQSEVGQVTDEQSYEIKAWAAHMKAEAHPGSDPKAEGDAQDDVDTGIAVYPTSVELYLLAGDMAPTALQATPYYLAALELQPSHPLASRWKPTVPPIPSINQPAGKTPTLQFPTFKLYRGMGDVHHPIRTRSPEAQAYFVQGLCLLYGYVDNGALKSFEVAIQYDPDCAMAWWGLSFCPPPNVTAAQCAARGWQLARTDAEKRYCAARILQLEPKHDSQALDAVCGAIAAYPRDVDLWVWRASWYGFAGEEDDRRGLHEIPLALAAHRLDPTHPSPNHELIHAYEAIDRPVLGWPYTWGFRRSAPHLPHAQHMQAHLAMRLGRWKDAMTCTRLSVKLSAEGYPELDPNHHLNVYTWAMAHEGRFNEAWHARKSTEQDSSWPRLLRLKLDDAALAAWARTRMTRVGDGPYFLTLADLDRGRTREAENDFKHFSRNVHIWYGADPNLWNDELQGRLWLQDGHASQGVEKLASVARWSDGLPESRHWGEGAYYDELWGEAALQRHDFRDAQWAFGEALAHEHGSIVGAVGMQVLSEEKHEVADAAQYSAMARSIWSEADPGALDRLTARMRLVAAGKAPIF